MLSFLFFLSFVVKPFWILLCVFHITVSLFVYVLTGCRSDAAADSGGEGVF